MMNVTLLPLTICCAVVLNHVVLVSEIRADVRSSADYSIISDTLDSGGARTSSVSYTNDGSMGGIVGVSSVAFPPQTSKHGYVGQLYDAVAFSITAPFLTLDETSSLPLSAWQLLDDDTLLEVSAMDVSWEVLNGPIGVDMNGMATAGTVYANTAATLLGSFGGDIDFLSFIVLEAIPDNFGSYAGDGIGDDWQVFHFGLDHPDAGPGGDPDGDGQNNLFEFNARLDPRDSESFLDISLVPGPNPLEQVADGEAVLAFPGKVGVTYTIQYKDSLIDEDWTSLTAIVGSDVDVSFIDDNAGGLRKFYRVLSARTNP